MDGLRPKRRRGYRLALPVTCTALILGTAASPAVGQVAPPPCDAVVHLANVQAPELNRFSLGPTGAFEGACGMVELLPAWSPFGLAVSRTGRLLHDLKIVAHGLPQVDESGTPRSYVAWVTDPTLSAIEAVGEVGTDEVLTIRVDRNKVLVVITSEPAGAVLGQRWSGPIALMGRSRSALMRSLLGHSIFNRVEF